MAYCDHQKHQQEGCAGNGTSHLPTCSTLPIRSYLAPTALSSLWLLPSATGGHGWPPRARKEPGWVFLGTHLSSCRAAAGQKLQGCVLTALKKCSDAASRPQMDSIEQGEGVTGFCHVCHCRHALQLFREPHSSLTHYGFTQLRLALYFQNK